MSSSVVFPVSFVIESVSIKMYKNLLLITPRSGMNRDA